MRFRQQLVYCTATLIILSCIALTTTVGHAATPFRGMQKTAGTGEFADGLVKFTLGIGGGYLTGESRELVYWPEFNNHKASELIWEIDNVYMINFNGAITIAKNWFIKLDGWVEVSDGDGTMDDYDWVNVGGEWTHWSHHENTDVTEANMLDLHAGWKFINKRMFVLSCMFGYKRDCFNWESYGGDYIYSSSTGFRDEIGSFDDGEPCIGYEQTFRAVYAGLGFEVNLGKVFSLSGRAIYSPFVECKAVDHHYMRNLVTEDDFNDGDMFACDIKATFKFLRHFAVDLGYSYLYYDEIQGDSLWIYYDENAMSYCRDGAGADHESSVFSLMLRYTF